MRIRLNAFSIQFRRGRRAVLSGYRRRGKPAQTVKTALIDESRTPPIV